MKHLYLLRLAALLLLLVLAAAARAQNVGIGTTSPTQKLDVDGSLRVRALQGEGLRLPQVQADGTLGMSAPPYTTPPQGSTVAALASAATVDNPTAVAVSGTTAYVVTQSSATAGSLQVFEVRNPTSPALLNATNPRQGTATSPKPVAVAVSGTTVYVLCQTLGSQGKIEAFDVANPAAPVLLNPHGNNPFTEANPTALAVSDGRAYVSSPFAAGAGGLQIYDVSTPGLLTLLSTSSGITGANPTGIAVRGTTAYVVGNASTTAGALQVFDVSDPANPVQLNSGRTAGTPTSIQPQSVAVSGASVYVVARNGAGRTTALAGSLQVFDVSDPTSPALRNPTTAGGTTGGTPTDPLPVSVAVSGTTAYVVNQTNARTSGSLQVFAYPLGQGQLITVNPDGSLASVAAAGLPGDNLGNHTATRQVVLTGAGVRFSDGTSQTTAAVGDNLGNHTASRNLDLAGYQLVGNGGSQGLAISSSGLVEQGGQPTPTLLLHSNDNNLVAGATLQFREATDTYGWNLRHNTGGSEGGSTSDRLLLDRLNGNGPATVMTWDQGTGNVGIGTTTPGFPLDVAGTIRCTGFSSTSDARLKQQVRPLTGALAAVQRLRGVRYTWNALGVQRGGAAGAGQVGLLAQELEKVYPELVSTGPDGYKAVNYAQLTPVLLEALKELAAQNVALEARQQADRADLQRLKQQLAQLQAVHALR